MATSTRRRAAIYVRISLDFDKDDPELKEAGVTRQIEDCLEKVAQLDLELVHEPFKDNDVSATSGAARPRWDELMQLVRTRQIDAVVAWHSDRLYRLNTELEAVVDEFWRAGVQIYTCQSGDIDLSSDTGRMVARMLTSVANHEGERKAARQRRAIRQKAEMGKPHGGPAPLGYRYVASPLPPRPNGRAHPKQLVPDPVAGEILREGARRIIDAAAKKESGANVRGEVTWAAEWVSEQLKARTDRTKTLGRIALVTAYRKGTMAGKRMYLPEADRLENRRLRAEGVPIKDLLQPEVFNGTWEPILPPEMWEDLVMALDTLNSPRPGDTLTRRLLTGIIRCGGDQPRRDDLDIKVRRLFSGDASFPYLHDRCCARMVGSSSMYRCPSSGTGCRKINIDNQLDAYVEALVLERLRQTRPELLAVAEQPALSSYDAKVQALRKKVSRLEDAYEDGVIDLQRLKDRRAELAAAERDRDAALDQRINTMTVTQSLLSALDDWSDADVEDKRTIVHAMIDVIAIMPAAPQQGFGRKFQPERVKIKWRVGAPA